MSIYNLVSACGLVFFCLLAWALSAHRHSLNWRVIGWGVGLQLAIGLFIFIVPAGYRLFAIINGLVVTMLGAASQGARFVFGNLALPPGTEGSMGFFLAFQALPSIIFFSALVSVLYYTNILPAAIRLCAALFSRLMRISGAESLCAATNIFVGVESALVIRPHLDSMTRSELATVLTAGMATVASNVLALYVFTLQSRFPAIAGHLVSASLLSAPAAIVMAKIILPETGQPQTLGITVRPHYERERNVFDAVITGANNGLKVIAGIVALLVAVLGLVALADLGLQALGARLNQIMNTTIDWSFKGLLGYLFYLPTLALGIVPADAWQAARIIGERTILTEVASYQDLAAAIAAGSIVHERSVLIISYALCGFAHVASMAIFIGGISALAPQRTHALTTIAARCLLAATLACMMTACVAGIFYTGTTPLLIR